MSFYIQNNGGGKGLVVFVAVFSLVMLALAVWLI